MTETASQIPETVAGVERANSKIIGLRAEFLGLNMKKTALDGRGTADERHAAKLALRAGHSAIVDAVHRTAEERSLLAAVADRAGSRFVGLWLDAPLDVLINRVSSRNADASDATASVVTDQASHLPGPIDWTRLDATASAEALATTGLDAAQGIR